MAIDVTVKKTEPMTVAFLFMKGPCTLIGESFVKLYGWIGEKGYVPAGPPMGVYFNSPEHVPPEELLWELQSPIGGDVAPSDPDERGVGVKKAQGGEVASTMHRGPFEEVGTTYGALVAWIMENGYEIVGPATGVYFSDPAKTPPDELLTEARFPVSKN